MNNGACHRDRPQTVCARASRVELVYTDALLISIRQLDSQWDFFAIFTKTQFFNYFTISTTCCNRGHSDESPDYTFGACAGRYGCRRRRFFSSATGDLPGRYVYVPQATPPPPPPSTKISFGAFFFWFLRRCSYFLYMMAFCGGLGVIL